MKTYWEGKRFLMKIGMVITELGYLERNADGTWTAMSLGQQFMIHPSHNPKRAQRYVMDKIIFDLEESIINA